MQGDFLNKFILNYMPDLMFSETVWKKLSLKLFIDIGLMSWMNVGIFVGGHKFFVHGLDFEKVKLGYKECYMNSFIGYIFYMSFASVCLYYIIPTMW